MFIRDYERQWVVDMDLSKCFDTLDHEIIIKAFRKADDTLIFTRSKSAAANARKQATRYLEGKLKLTVNQRKTHIVHSSEEVKFLGVVIRTGFTRIQDKKIREFKHKVKKITRRNSPVNLEKVIADLNPLASFAIPNNYLMELGLFDLCSVQTGIPVSV